MGKPGLEAGPRKQQEESGEPHVRISSCFSTRPPRPPAPVLRPLGQAELTTLDLGLSSRGDSLVLSLPVQPQRLDGWARLPAPLPQLPRGFFDVPLNGFSVRSSLIKPLPHLAQISNLPWCFHPWFQLVKSSAMYRGHSFHPWSLGKSIMDKEGQYLIFWLKLKAGV